MALIDQNRTEENKSDAKIFFFVLTYFIAQ